MKKKKIIFFVCVMVLGLTGVLPARATEALPSFWERAKQTVSATWHSDEWTMLIPVNTWHNRLTYDHKKIKEYNERPWGFGIAKTYESRPDIRHSLFAMAFLDSHDDLEPIAGYAWQKLWALDAARDWRLTAGVMVGITMRSDYDYIPIPAPLPIFGIEYKRLSVESTYVPGFQKNSGNILFTWLRWRF